MEVKAMTKLKTLLAAAAAVLVSFTASAEELAARTDRPVTPVSEILRSIETRPDYESQVELRYNPRDHVYLVLYNTKDGDSKLLIVDAFTGQETQ